MILTDRLTDRLIFIRYMCKSASESGTLTRSSDEYPSVVKFPFFPPVSPLPCHKAAARKPAKGLEERCKLMQWGPVKPRPRVWRSAVSSCSVIVWVKPRPTHFGAFWARKSHLAATVIFVNILRKSSCIGKCRNGIPVFKKVAERRSGAFRLNLTIYRWLWARAECPHGVHWSPAECTFITVKVIVIETRTSRTSCPRAARSWARYRGRSRVCSSITRTIFSCRRFISLMLTATDTIQPTACWTT